MIWTSSVVDFKTFLQKFNITVRVNFRQRDTHLAETSEWAISGSYS